MGIAMKNTFSLLNNVISKLDLFKILTYYMKGDMTTRKFYKNISLYRTRNQNNRDKIISKFCSVAFPKDLKGPFIYLGNFIVN